MFVPLYIVISGPSGAGKSTLIHRLRERDPSLKLSVSTTTRPPRLHEVEGRDYLFTTRERFCEARDQGRFLEYVQIFDHYYGTSKDWLDSHFTGEVPILFDVNREGAEAISRFAPQASVRILILPPSEVVLEERLRNRKTETTRSIEQRLNEMKRDIAAWPDCDYCIRNDDIDVSSDQLWSIVQAERLNIKRLKHFGVNVTSLECLKMGGRG